MTLTGYMSGLFAAVLPKPRTNPKVRRPAVEAAAEAKRARKAAKRDEDARRTAEGRWLFVPPAKLGWRRSADGVRWGSCEPLDPSWEMALNQWDAYPRDGDPWPRWRERCRITRDGRARPWWASRVQRWRAWRKAYLGRPARMRAIRDAEDGSFRRQREGTRQRLTHYLDGRRFLAEVASLYGRLS